MSNVIKFPSSDIQYIIGNKEAGEPHIVGVQCENISIQLSPNLKDVLLGDVEIRREELIAFVLAAGIHTDIVTEASAVIDKEEPEWISINDRMPEYVDIIGSSEAVLLYRPKAPDTNDPLVCVGFYKPSKTTKSPQGIEHNFDCWCHPTHWAKIPKPPVS